MASGKKDVSERDQKYTFCMSSWNIFIGRAQCQSAMYEYNSFALNVSSARLHSMDE